VLRNLTLFFVNLFAFTLLSGCGNKAIDEQKEKIINKSQEIQNETEKERLQALGERLINAVSNEDDNIIKSNLANGANPNFQSVTGKTPLTLAAKYGYEGIVRLLIKMGADVNLKDTQGQLPITEAVKNNHRSIMRFLVSMKADVNVKEGNNDTPLSIAIKKRSLLLATDLILSGANIYNIDRRRRSAFTIARREAANSLIPLIKDVSKLKIEGLTSEHLTQIIKLNRQDTLAYIKKNVKVSNEIKTKNHVYQVVAHENDIAKFYFLKQLINMNFNLNGIDGQNIPLNYAVINQDFDTVITLLKNGANPNQLNSENKTSILYAVRDLKPNLVRLLLEYKATRFFTNDQNYKVDACRFLPFRSGFFSRGRSDEQKEKRKEIADLLDC
jgi:ankyrin repeat protein